LELTTILVIQEEEISSKIIEIGGKDRREKGQVLPLDEAIRGGEYQFGYRLRLCHLQIHGRRPSAQSSLSILTHGQDSSLYLLLFLQIQSQVNRSGTLPRPVAAC